MVGAQGDERDPSIPSASKIVISLMSLISNLEGQLIPKRLASRHAWNQRPLGCHRIQEIQRENWVMFPCQGIEHDRTS